MGRGASRQHEGKDWWQTRCGGTDVGLKED